MKVSELGEFGLIDLLARKVEGARDRRIPSWRKLIVGIGDDAAAWHGNATTQLATVDSLVQDVDFTLDIISWRDLGWKALAVNLSDIAAMGGRPDYALVALGLPGDTQVDDVVSLYDGVLDLARQSGVVIVGGDISGSRLVVITITVIGSAANQSYMLTRSAARPGEQIAVTGYLGGAAAGLEMLRGQLRFGDEVARALKNAFVHPSARVAEGQMLLEQGVRTAIDVSDGLVLDLTHICQQSQVGARVEIDRVPVHPAARDAFGERSLEMALSGGEDFELLFTAADEVMSKVKAVAACPITIVGETTANNRGEVVLVDTKGTRVSVGKRGWEHFSGDEAKQAT